MEKVEEGAQGPERTSPESTSPEKDVKVEVHSIPIPEGLMNMMMGDRKESLKSLNFAGSDKKGMHRFSQREKPVFAGDTVVGKVTLRGLVNYVRSKSELLLERANGAVFLVNEEDASICLDVNHAGGYSYGKNHDRYEPRIVIAASATKSSDAKLVEAIMGRNWSSLSELGVKLRDCLHLFPSKEMYKQVVGQLRNATLVVKRILQEASDDSGNKAYNFEQKLENAGDLSIAWTFRYRMFDGEEPIELPVVIVYGVNQSLSGVDATVFSAERVNIERAEKERLVTRTIKDLSNVLSKGSDTESIPFVYQA